jgi:hypothetical protein
MFDIITISWMDAQCIWIGNYVYISNKSLYPGYRNRYLHTYLWRIIKCKEYHWSLIDVVLTNNLSIFNKLLNASKYSKLFLFTIIIKIIKPYYNISNNSYFQICLIFRYIHFKNQLTPSCKCSLFVWHNISLEAFKSLLKGLSLFQMNLMC